MMTTPIIDFVNHYLAASPARFHMPGHKGIGPLGVEGVDITEIDGAGELYAPGGIISQSERNASRLFGADTYYSAEGSSLAIRAMLYLALGRMSEKPVVLAGRNAHRAFLSAAALVGFDVEWLHPKAGEGYATCAVSPADVDAALMRLGGRCGAVYLTSPDYLGNTLDIAGIAAACRRRGALLLVDSAHGAYLKFLSPSRHPVDLGADMCCDSAHKTLPALTGAAYLHVSPRLGLDARRVKGALALFGSSSPSWLVLQSLDACNRALEDYPERLAALITTLDALKAALAEHGYALVGDEPMKLTISARSFGYTGDALAARLMDRGICPEFHDPDYVTLMPSPMNNDSDLERLRDVLLSVERHDPLPQGALPITVPQIAMRIREATFVPRETLPADACEGRVLAAPALSCPPCVPIAVCGERIDAGMIERMRYYGITKCEVVINETEVC